MYSLTRLASAEGLHPGVWPDTPSLPVASLGLRPGGWSGVVRFRTVAGLPESTGCGKQLWSLKEEVVQRPPPQSRLQDQPGCGDGNKDTPRSFCVASR